MKLHWKTALRMGITVSLLAAATPVEAATQTGIASWYQKGARTANGEAYNPDGMTAAHRSLPFGTIVEVTNLANGRTARLRINDRGPFVGGRIIDVSRGGARQLGLMGSGTARVRVTSLGRGQSRAARATRATRSFDADCITGVCF